MFHFIVMLRIRMNLKNRILSQWSKTDRDFSLSKDTKVGHFDYFAGIKHKVT